jgi:hypothetical protein
MKYNDTQGKWCKNKHGASKIIDTFETYHVHHVDKASYLKGNVDCVDPDEVVVVFVNIPTNA